MCVSLANGEHPPPQRELHSCIRFYRPLAVGAGDPVLSSENRPFAEFSGSALGPGAGSYWLHVSPCHSTPGSLSLQPPGPGLSTSLALKEVSTQKSVRPFPVSDSKLNPQ